MRKTTSGFTMVELLVVIAIIGILATITFMGFGRYQADTRDNARASQATIISEALEKYYEQNGEYPGCPALTGSAATVTSSVLPGLQAQVLVTPNAPSSTTNSIQCTDLTSTSQPDFFAYVGDSSSTCTTGTACLIYQFKYIQETTGKIITINSRHQTSLAISGAPNLSSSPDGTNGFTQINSSWGAVASSTSYDIQRSTSSDFLTAPVTVNTTATTLSSSGLIYNTMYFFRVRANSATGSGPWSNTSIVSTWTLATPSVSAVANSSTTLTSSWSAINHAASYNVQCSYDNTNWGGSYCGAASTTATSFGWGPTSQGTTLYFRTQAVNGVYTSSWSPSASATTTIDAPAAYSITSYNSLAGGWNVLHATSNAVCPSGTTPSYDWYANNNFWVSGTQYQSVGYSLNWNDNITLSVASRCITSATSSSFVWANNTASMSLPYSTVSVTGIAFRTMGWGGTCPNYTTSSSYDWFVMANRGGWSAGANGVQYTSYANTGVAWGDGDIRVRLHCNGPWGGDAYTDGWYDYGSGCVPTITTSWCTY